MRRKLIAVVWEDASGPAREGWSHVADWRPGQYLCCTVGWLFKETSTHLHLAASFGNIESQPDEQMCGVMAIPKRMIKKQRTLKDTLDPFR